MARNAERIRVTMVEEVHPVAEDKLELVRRVGASAAFERSPRLRELLFYICDQALQHRLEDLKEQVIGQRVFGRAADYSPGDDNIVRAEARQLRKRLEEYFATEGKAEPVVIVIPKGGYVPAFEPREAPPAAEPAPRPAPVTEPLPQTGRRRRIAWLAIALFGGLAFLEALWVLPTPFHGERTGAAASSSAPHETIWPLLFDGRQQTMIVCADSTLVMAQAITHAPISLQEYVDREYGRGNTHLKPSDIALLRTIQGWQFTDITDVRLVQEMSRLNASHWDRVAVRSARTVGLQDFKAGNVILLGSSHSNPWDLLFEPQQNFRFGFDFDPANRSAYIQNMAPLPGEPSTYRAASPGQSGEVYSTITLIPDLRHDGNVLIIAGTTAESTETAGEFIMNPEASAGLMRTLLSRNQGKIPYFEVLLKSGAFAGVTQRAEVVALRILAAN
jgi:hypothetical protein